MESMQLDRTWSYELNAAQIRYLSTAHLNNMLLDAIIVFVKTVCGSGLIKCSSQSWREV